VSVQIIDDKNPARLWVRRDNSLNVFHKIFRRASFRQLWSDDFARRNIQIAKQICRPVPLIIVLDTLRLARRQRNRRGCALQRLNAGLLVNTDRVNAVRFIFSRIKIRLANLFYPTVRLFGIIDLGIEPTTALVGR